MHDPLTPYADAERPPYLVALGVTLGALALYVLTLAPTTQFWDTSEYMTAAHALGIAHPPGNPLFIILGHVWGLLPLGADVLLNAVETATRMAETYSSSENEDRHGNEPNSPRVVGFPGGNLSPEESS